MSKPLVGLESEGFEKPVNRAYETRRDNDSFVNTKITLYDIDYAILWWLENKIKPHVIENDVRVDVSVKFASGEIAQDVQKDGYLRDSFKGLHLEDTPFANRIVQKTTRQKRSAEPIDALINVKKSETTYLTAIPRAVRVSYDLLIWTDYISQMNHIVQDIMQTSGYDWGDTWKFDTMVESTSFETEVSLGERRAVRSNMSLNVRGYLLDDFNLDKSTVTKAHSVKRVNFGNDSSAFSAKIIE
jgi:hypothetical protein